VISKDFLSDQRKITTPSGTISYVERGSGRVALLVHGVLLNGYVWRHQLDHLADLRRCIAVDLLGHGDTTTTATQDVSVTANARMLAEFLDALKIDRVDLADKSIYRSPQALGPAYENPDAVSDETIEIYLRPHLHSAARTHDLERFVNAFDSQHTVTIEDRLRLVQAPTLIAWGTDDVYFDLKWSRWLEKTIPGTKKRVELKSARIFFPEERWSEFNAELRTHWTTYATTA
jgi:pimeloyl-ACP methyl ester carboxylesterase